MECLNCKPVILLLIFLFHESICQVDSNLIVETPLGTIRGQRSEENFTPVIGNTAFGDTPGMESIQFLGVPYAEPPTGLNRFKPPVPVQPWNETLNATAYGAACMQERRDLVLLLRDARGSTTNEGRLDQDVEISEDCLYLNIYTPTDNFTNLPVMLFIHGGNFITGTGSMYKGANLANATDVIVVTMNYRLGAFGFLTNGTDAMPGNLGLLDQRMALEWVQNNIGSFGGDVDRITLFGEGAGGSAVHLHTLATESSTLFSRAIIQSAQYNDQMWATDRAVQQYEDFMQALDPLEPDTGLENATATDLQAISNDLGAWSPHNYSQFGVLFPHDVIAQESFSTNIDVMIGSNDAAGSNAAAATTSFENITATVIVNVFPELFGQITQDLVERMSRAYQQFYGGHVTNVFGLSDVEYNAEVTSFLTDQLYATWATEVSVANSRGCHECSVFQYKFTQTSQSPITGVVTGASLGQEMSFVFGYNEFNPELNDVMMTYWTNFAKSGDPNSPGNVTAQWPAYDATNSNACPLRFDLGSNTVTGDAIANSSSDDVITRSFDFWNLYYDVLGLACPVPSNETTNADGSDVTTDEVCEASVGETLGIAISNELAGILLIVFIVLTGVFLIAFIVAIVCYCKTKKKLKKEKKKNKHEGHDNPVADAYKL